MENLKSCGWYIGEPDDETEENERRRKMKNKLTAVEISKQLLEIAEIFENSDDETALQALVECYDGMTADLADVFNAARMVINRLDAEIDAYIKPEINRLQTLAKAKEKRIDNIKQFFGGIIQLHGGKLKTPLGNFGTSQSVDIVDSASLPTAYWREVPERVIAARREPDKVAIKAVLQEGQYVTGAKLVNKLKVPKLKESAGEDDGSL